MENFDPKFLNSAYNLSDRQVNDFQKNGHILLPNVLEPEGVQHFEKVISAAVSKFNTEKRSLAERDAYGKAFLQIMNLWQRDEIVRNFSLAKRFAEVAAKLLGVEKVRIYHDQALYKEPGGAYTPWHKDQFYWPLDTNKTITMWMPLVDLNHEMGILQFAPGTHLFDINKSEHISESSHVIFDKYLQDRNIRKTNIQKINAGDATFHYGWTLHYAPANSSRIMRKVMTIIYFADGAKVIIPDNEFRQNDLKEWLSGVKPGNNADGPLNPLVN